MNRPLATALTVLTFLSLLDNCLGNSFNYIIKKNFNVDGNNLLVCIPPEMNIEFTPMKLETSGEMSMLFYKFASTGKEDILGLHWFVFVSDYKGRMLKKDSWWDRGEWKSKTEVEESTAFAYKKEPGTLIVIVLQEMQSKAGIKSIDTDLLEKEVPDLITGKRNELTSAMFVPHEKVLLNDESDLIKRSMKVILGSADLRNSLTLNGQDVFLLTNNIAANEISGINNINLISERQLSSKLKRGESINYFEYCCYEIAGSSVRFVFNYHMPTIVGNAYINKGIRVKLNFSKNRDHFVLTDINTEHF